MKTFFVPDEVCERQVEAVLDRHWSRGLTFPKGDQEDFSRVWFTDAEKVEYRVVVMYSTALLQVDNASVHLPELKAALGLRDLDQVFEDAQNAEGVDRFWKLMNLGCMAARNDFDEAFDARLCGLWAELVSSDDPRMVSIGLAVAPLLHKSSQLKSTVRQMNPAGWEAKLEEVERLWESFEKPTLLPTRDVDRLLKRSADALAAMDFQLAFEAAQDAINENPYLLQAQVLRARALDGLGDSWGAWVAMESARSYGAPEDDSDFDGFIELHRAKVENAKSSASPTARSIALELYHSFQPDLDHLYDVFRRLDTEWRSRWVFAMHFGMPSEDSLEELEPDSYMVSFLMGNQAADRGDQAAAMAYWQRWNERPEFLSGSFDAWALEFFDRVTYGKPSIETSAFALLEAHSQQKNWAEVVELADFWLSVEPNSIQGFVWKGIGCTWLPDSDLAIAAYDKAIELYLNRDEDSFVFGEEPAATAYFNRACERVNAGLVDDQVFEDLSAAVRLAPRFAAAAVEDDYLAACFDDPRFEAAIHIADVNDCDCDH